jgi:hypothetical protein
MYCVITCRTRGKPSACEKRRFASPVLHRCNVKTQICVTRPQCVKMAILVPTLYVTLKRAVFSCVTLLHPLCEDIMTLKKAICVHCFFFCLFFVCLFVFIFFIYYLLLLLFYIYIILCLLGQPCIICSGTPLFATVLATCLYSRISPIPY